MRKSLVQSCLCIRIFFMVSATVHCHERGASSPDGFDRDNRFLSRVTCLSRFRLGTQKDCKASEILSRNEVTVCRIIIKRAAKQRQVFGEVLVALQRVSVCFTCPFRPIGGLGQVEFYPSSGGEAVIAVVIWVFTRTIDGEWAHLILSNTH